MRRQKQMDISKMYIKEVSDNFEMGLLPSKGAQKILKLLSQRF